MPISAEDGWVVWRMRPGRARKIALVLRRWTNAVAEWTGLELAADKAEGQT